MFYTDYRFWFLALFGLFISIILNVCKPAKPLLKISERKFEWLFLSFNFVLLIWNASFTLRIAQITAESDTLNSADLGALAYFAYIFEVLAIIGVGFLVGEVIFTAVEGYRNRQKEKKQKTEILISTEKLDATKKEIQDYKKVLNDLTDFFSDLGDNKKK